MTIQIHYLNFLIPGKLYKLYVLTLLSGDELAQQLDLMNASLIVSSKDPISNQIVFIINFNG